MSPGTEQRTHNSAGPPQIAGQTPSSPAASANDRSLAWYATREPLVVLALSAIAILFLFAITGLSRVYQNQLRQRGTTWFERGLQDVQADRLPQAVTDFQSALTYSRDNYDYELSLAEALLAMRRTEEARAYLINLWQREPENGSVNLELARIYADKDDITRALRYYHNAIYAVWGSGAEAHQRSVRLELIKFLLDHKSLNQAESELIAVGRDLPDDASLHVEIANFFMEVPDYDRAFDQYREALKIEHHNATALAGAGRAALQLARFSAAGRYLAAAVSVNPGDRQVADMLNMVKAVPTLDPYEITSTAQRDRVVMDDFNTAGERLNACVNTLAKQTAGSSLSDLYSRWMDLKTALTERSLRQHPDQVDAAMDLVFGIERQTNDVCGSPTGTDLILFLIAKNHEGS